MSEITVKNIESANESKTQVSNKKNDEGKPKQPKERKSVPFTDVKKRALVLFNQGKWHCYGDVVNEALFFRACLRQAIKEKVGYSEYDFKTDLCKHMSYLLRDWYFQKDIFNKKQSLLEVSQRCAWLPAKQFIIVRNDGIDNVVIELPDFMKYVNVYHYSELEGFLTSLGFDENYFRNDPYTQNWLDSHPDAKGPNLPGQEPQDAGQEPQAPAA